MARPIQYMDMHPLQLGSEGVGDQNVPGLIPNGQPVHLSRPPVYPEKAPRPFPGNQPSSLNPPPLNGIQQYNHPSSLSSHSSRDPSPVPQQQRQYVDNLSNSTPNLASVPSRPPGLYSHSNQQTPNRTPPQMSPVPAQYNPNGHTTGSVPDLGAMHTTRGPSSNQTAAASQPQLGFNSNSVPNRQQTSQPGSLRPQMPTNGPAAPNNSQFGQQIRQPTSTMNTPPTLGLNSDDRQQPNMPQSAGQFRPQLSQTLPQTQTANQNILRPPHITPPNQGQSMATPNIPNASFPTTKGVSFNQLSNPGLQNQRYPSPATSTSSVPSSQFPGMAPPIARTNAQGTLPPPWQEQTDRIGPPGPNQSRMAPYGQMGGHNGPNSQPIGQPPLGPGMPPRLSGPGPGSAASPFGSGVGSRLSGPGIGMSTTAGTLPPPGSGNTVFSGMPPSSTGMPPSSTGMPLIGSGMPPRLSGPSVGLPVSGPGMPPLSTGSMPPRLSGPPTSGPGMPPLNTGMPPRLSGPGMGQPPPINGPPAGAVTHQYGSQLPPHPEGSHLPKRYPQQPSQPTAYSPMAPQPSVDANFNQKMGGMSIAQQGFSKLWGADSYDLLQTRNILPAEKVETPRVKLQQEFLDAVNCSPDLFRCTMTKIPETSSLLQKSRLPLGILIHPFKDLNHLAVIQCQSIVRCRACRTYINPFVYFVDHKRWKCNLCFRVNELPEEFQFDPVSKTYGDPSRRPEIKSSTIEFIAPSEYMLRPPQPAVYLFLLDVSCLATECGYLRLFCDILLDELDKLPGDGRTQVGFITYDSAVHFYSLTEGLNQPQQMIVVDVDDIFLPCPFSLVVNLNESKELVRDLLKDLPKKFAQSHDNKSALGPALQAAYKLMSPTGGRITVFQSCLPNFGPGALASREDPSARAGKEVAHLNPATDFYKRLALDCSGQQIAVDLFIVNQQYCDLATLSGISRFSGGSIHHFPLFKLTNLHSAEAFEQSFRRYLTRKLGLEAVMRIRCSRGLAIHTFHGNFFVRSTDLLSLPNVNPDAGFGMQVSVEESLSDLQNVCFQAALLYTSSKGERRIRVHTLCLPVAANLSDILHSADQQCIVGLLAKMAVDRSHLSSLADAREAFINVAIDILSAYKVAQAGGATGLLAPHNLRLLPMYLLALLKYVAFRTGQSTRLDDRLFAMCQMKTLPLNNLIQEIYPDLYPVHRLSEHATIDVEGVIIPQPPRLQLTAEKLESSGAFLLDSGDTMILFIGRNVNVTFCQAVFGVNTFNEISEDVLQLPEIDTPESESLRNFVHYLHAEKSYPATFHLIRDDSQNRQKFYERLLEDRSESTLSYYEFLQHLKTNVK